MEGVLVSAKKDGSTITTTVATDENGHYGFPADRLDPGHYALTIRAVGYDLKGPASADVHGSGVKDTDLTLVKTGDLQAQLSNAEWAISVPGNDHQKSVFLNCTECHTLNRPLESSHTADEFVQVMTRMSGYAYNSSTDNPQRWATTAPFDPKLLQHAAAFLSGINLSKGPYSYQFKTLPRVKGVGTHVIITEYDLPRAPVSQPHDVVIDPNGIAWYADFGKQVLGRLDPRTGAVKEYPLPMLKPAAPTGELDVRNGPNGQIWIGMHFQSALGLFDPKTEKLKVFALRPDQQLPNTQTSMIAGDHQNVDGKVWTGDALGAWRLDTKSGQFERVYTFPPLPEANRMPGLVRGVASSIGDINVNAEPRAHAMYGIQTDSHNNMYGNDFAGGSIFRFDAKTGKRTDYQTSGAYSRPRRGNMDNQDRLWFAEYNANRIGMLDTRTGHMKEWQVPTPWTAPYDVQYDNKRYAWTAGMMTDRVVRLDTSTGKFVEFQLPRPTNVRRMFVDTRGGRDIIWVGSNHGSSIVKVEPLD